MTLPYWSMPSPFNFLFTCLLLVRIQDTPFYLHWFVNSKKMKFFKFSCLLFVLHSLYMFYIRYQCLSTACPNFGTVEVQGLSQF